jgi:hypothetical protein
MRAPTADPDRAATVVIRSSRLPVALKREQCVDQDLEQIDELRGGEEVPGFLEDLPSCGQGANEGDLPGRLTRWAARLDTAQSH